MEMVRKSDDKTKYESKRFSSINHHMADKWVKQERHCVCTRNTEQHLHHCCSGKAISITYSVCVSVAIVIQHAMSMHHMVTGGMHCSILCFNIVSYMA